MNAQDQWSKWLLETRFGGSVDAARRGLAQLHQVRDRVLKNAAIQQGETILDVGCGDGLIAFGALDRVGDGGTVIFSDISAPLLEHCERIAAASGLSEQCMFLKAPAEDLSHVHDSSVDVVTIRSVLIYVKNKSTAFEEFHRVLRPGGRASIFEPINRFGLTYEKGSWLGMEIPEVSDLAVRLKQHYLKLQPPDSDPMMDFDEHDLLCLAEDAGFENLHLEYHVLVAPSPPADWESMINSPGNPNIPSLAEAMNQIFTTEQRAQFERCVRPQVEAGGKVMRNAVAYLTARKAG